MIEGEGNSTLQTKYLPSRVPSFRKLNENTFDSSSRESEARLGQVIFDIDGCASARAMESFTLENVTDNAFTEL